MFRKIRGQKTALHILNTAIDNQRVAQAYLFHGPEGTGKSTTALYFAMAVNCLSMSEYRPCGVCSSCRKFLVYDHPDLIYIFPMPSPQKSLSGELKMSDIQKHYELYINNKTTSPWLDYYFNASVEIRKESVNLLTRRLSLSMYEAKHRICIIDKADQMNAATSNAFLKTLEEPPDSTIIILVSSRPSMLLPTIVSRCQSIAFQPVAPKMIENILQDDFNINREKARMISRLADGSVKRAIYLAQDESTIARDTAFEFFRLCSESKDLEFYRLLQKSSASLSKDNASDLIRYICMFVADLSILQQAQEHLVNIDKSAEILQILNNLPKTKRDSLADNVFQFTLSMEDLNRRISGNANMHLAMVNLYTRMNHIFRD